MDKKREELFDKCLELGLPVDIDDNIDTLEEYLKLAEEDEAYFDDGLTDDLIPPARVKKRGILKKLGKIALLFSKG
jgi:hypothetical protein